MSRLDPVVRLSGEPKIPERGPVEPFVAREKPLGLEQGMGTDHEIREDAPSGRSGTFAG